MNFSFSFYRHQENWRQSTHSRYLVRLEVKSRNSANFPSPAPNHGYAFEAFWGALSFLLRLRHHSRKRKSKMMWGKMFCSVSGDMSSFWPTVKCWLLSRPKIPVNLGRNVGSPEGNPYKYLKRCRKANT